MSLSGQSPDVGGVLRRVQRPISLDQVGVRRGDPLLDLGHPRDQVAVPCAHLLERLADGFPPRDRFAPAPGQAEMKAELFLRQRELPGIFELIGMVADERLEGRLGLVTGRQCLVKALLAEAPAEIHLVPRGVVEGRGATIALGDRLVKGGARAEESREGFGPPAPGPMVIAGVVTIHPRQG